MDLWQFIKGEEQIGAGGGSGIHVVLGVDRNFMRPLGVAMTSVLMHNLGADMYIFTDELAEEDKKRLLRTADKYNGAVHVLYVDPSAFAGFVTTEYWSIAMYFRLLIDVLYGRMERLIYIDADTIVIEPLTELLAWDLGDRVLGAVTELTFFDQDEKTMAEHWRRIGSVGESYFNSGVLLIDMEAWHSMKVGEVAIELANANPERWSFAPDQDILNAIYMGKVCWLPEKFNYHTRDGGHQVIPAGTVIAHYTATPKPWSKCHQNFDSPWRRIAAISEWRDVPLEEPRTTRDHRLMSRACFHNGRYAEGLKYQLFYLLRKLRGIK